MTKYKSFLQRKNKFRYLWNNIDGVSSDIDNIKRSQDLSKENIDNAKNTVTNYKKLIIFSTEFEPLEQFDFSPSLFSLFAWRNYEVEFVNADEKIIPSIRPSFEYRFAGADSSVKEELLGGSVIYTDKLVFTKTPTSIIMNTSVFLQHLLNDPEFLGFKEDFEVRMILEVVNQNTYL